MHYSTVLYVVYIYMYICTTVHIYMRILLPGKGKGALLFMSSYPLPIRGAKMRAAGSSAPRAAFAGSMWCSLTARSGQLPRNSALVVLATRLEPRDLNQARLILLMIARSHDEVCGILIVPSVSIVD